MIKDQIVVDAVVHPCDLSPQNQVPSAGQPLDSVYAAHRMASDAKHQNYVHRALTEQDRRNILGLSYIRMHGLGPAQVLREISNDEFTRARAGSIPQPWSTLRNTPVAMAA